MVVAALRGPDRVAPGHGGRTIYQKVADGYVLRVIVEEREGLSVVVTVYKARKARYEV